jgi:tetratricopeptide (TPR) repeat protein
VLPGGIKRREDLGVQVINKDAFELHQQGDLHTEAGRLEEALKSFRAALALDPLSVPLRFNIATTVRNLKRFDQAVDLYGRVLEISPNFAMAHHNKATALLQLGKLQEGFQEYEWRKVCPEFSDDVRYVLERPWAGEDLAGKTLFIYPELFQGDLIQFGRYALLAEKSGARVILGAPVAMHALLRTMSPTITLIADDAPTPEYDYQTALMSLPHLFGTSLKSVPSYPKYLQPEPSRVEHWKAHVGDHGFKVGIAWHGSARAALRSFPLAPAAERLGGIPGVRLISLQKHAGLDQLESLPEGSVETLGEDFDSGPDAFLDTAAAMACCDLFITLDTSVAHVAGAIGAPTWVALPYFGDWRWLERRADCPWYPSVQLYRQRSRGDWTTVFDEMGKALGRLTRAK